MMLLAVSFFQNCHTWEVINFLCIVFYSPHYQWIWRIVNGSFSLTTGLSTSLFYALLIDRMCHLRTVGMSLQTHDPHIDKISRTTEIDMVFVTVYSILECADDWCRMLVQLSGCNWKHINMKKTNLLMFIRDVLTPCSWYGFPFHVFEKLEHFFIASLFYFRAPYYQDGCFNVYQWTTLDCFCAQLC